MFKTSILVFISIIFTSCYSFKGISIPPEANTFFIEQFSVYPENIPPNEGQNFAELLKDKFRRESRLAYKDTDPDLEFSGAITEFRVSSEAPKAGAETSFNRLTIAVTVDYLNNKNEDNAWDKPVRFSQFYDYPSDQNLIDVQDEYIQLIFDQLVEDIFNKAFTNW
ncbi:MAG: hypothetical protein ACI9XO_002624 [Paraglaciecola sp.]|jgi:hypothetical protein